MAGKAIEKAFRKASYENIIMPERSKLDLLNINEVENFFRKNNPEVVIIAAAKVGGIYANSTYPADFILENLKIQINLIETAWKFGVKRLAFLGSSCIYPKFSKQPIMEEQLLTSSLEPTNEWYAIAKISGIKLCEALRKQYAFDAVNLMPTNLYGPGDNYHPQNSHVLPSLIRRFHEAKIKEKKEVVCWGTGSALREFLYVDDLGQSVLFALEEWDPNSPISPRSHDGSLLNLLNVGTGIDISIYELAHKVAAIIGFKGKIKWDKSKPDGTPKKLLDVTRINEIGWKARVGLDEGITLTYQHYLNELNSNLREK
ncbi:Nucleoside-diphosphate-sugar epimerase [Prochlorococcus marinus str. MIT 9215]|uniref:GDP-L-fucose synthase n=1 Tax=Prochlorococcus marinus (strain MIT 9215) TaxID=93060 RepID=A8G613_PROM2|nr:Nucleoside-diphosphate-sugar epimerase [Prochlorococcus marinus str. MIT 9215]